MDLRDKHGRPVTSATRTEDMPENMVKALLNKITVGAHCLAQAKKTQEGGMEPKRFCDYVKAFGDTNSVRVAPLAFRADTTTYGQLDKMLGLAENLSQLLQVYDIEPVADMSRVINHEEVRKLNEAIGLCLLTQGLFEISTLPMCDLTDSLDQVFQKTIAYRAAATTLGDLFLSQARKAKAEGKGSAFWGFVNTFQWTYGVSLPELSFTPGVTTYDDLGKWLGFSKGMQDFFDVYDLGNIHDSSQPISKEEFKRIDDRSGIGMLTKWVEDPLLTLCAKYSDTLADLEGRQKVGKTQPSSCFIATACYASCEAPEVLELRLFRDRMLLPYWYGRLMVLIYYTLSPPLARWLSKHSRTATFVRRLFLDPFVRLISDKAHTGRSPSRPQVEIQDLRQLK